MIDELEKDQLIESRFIFKKYKAIKWRIVSFHNKCYWSDSTLTRKKIFSYFAPHTETKLKLIVCKYIT